MRSVLQDWVMCLGLRMQGSLLTSIRGCDTAEKDDDSKAVQRAFRCAVLVPFCGDPRKAKTFIEHFDDEKLCEVLGHFVRSHDHYPHHFVMHLVHSAEIVGYYHPDPLVRERWEQFYRTMVGKFHLQPETQSKLEERLEAPEEKFWVAQ